MLIGIVPLLTWMGWLWRPLRLLTITTCLVALLAVWLYSPDGQLSHGDIQRADQVFLLKYLISSQSAILWMCALFLLATAAYWIGLASPTAAWIGTGLTWAGVFFGTVGLLVRWREGHLLGPGTGPMPVCSVYVVFAMLGLITVLFCL